MIDLHNDNIIVTLLIDKFIVNMKSPVDGPHALDGSVRFGPYCGQRGAGRRLAGVNQNEGGAWETRDI